MPIVIRFLITLGSSLAVVVGTSLLWPKVTTTPRPEPLTQVRDMVMGTSIGQSLANTLGVQDESAAEPVNIASVAGTTATSILSSLEQTAKEAATRELIIQVVKKIETLAPEQQQEIREQLCRP